VKLLLDETYRASSVRSFENQGTDATTVAELGMAGSSDADIFAAARDGGFVLLSENVSDFVRLCGEHVFVL
jgi:predicted nuclease of predicted toxin-antitoxin system